MKKTFILLMFVMLSGCATLDKVKGWVPSFWDDNQAHRIVDVRLAVDRLDCTQPHLPQVIVIRDNLRWVELYSESKGWRNNDIRRLIEPLQASVEDFYKRSQDKQGSVGYCEIKKKLLAAQAAKAAEATLGRF